MSKFRYAWNPVKKIRLAIKRSVSGVMDDSHTNSKSRLDILNKKRYISSPMVKIPCLKCQKMFDSVDKCANRICPKCDKENSTVSKRDSKSSGSGRSVLRGVEGKPD